jgi:cytoskeletal protein RodZ
MLMTHFLPYLDNYPNIGVMFSGQRQRQGHSIDDVCAGLSVSRFYIVGLESNRPDLLPTVAETRDLIRRYSRLLALDAQPILTEFDAWLLSCPKPEPSSFIVDVPRSSNSTGLKAAALACILMLYPAATTEMISEAIVINQNVTQAEQRAATLALAPAGQGSEQESADTPTTLEFTPKPYSDMRSADDIERDRLFYLQEQIRLGLEPVALPFKG